MIFPYAKSLCKGKFSYAHQFRNCDKLVEQESSGGPITRHRSICLVFNTLPRPCAGSSRMSAYSRQPWSRHLRLRSEASQRRQTRMSLQNKMSGLSKVEMSAFIGGRGRYGNGANRLESTGP